MLDPFQLGVPGAKPTLEPSSAPPVATPARAPACEIRSDWRGTFPEAVLEAERRGVHGFAGVDGAGRVSPRSASPQELARTFELVSARYGSAAAPAKVYALGEDGTIYNTLTKRTEYVPVHRDLRDDMPRIIEERRAAMQGAALGAARAREGLAAQVVRAHEQQQHWVAQGAAGMAGIGESDARTTAREREEAHLLHLVDEARTGHRLPEVVGLSMPERGALYSRLYLDTTDERGRQAFEDGRKVIFGMRVPTEVNANHGRGLYDDRMVVLQRQADGSTSVLYEGRATTDPSGRYEQGGPYYAANHPEGEDVDADGRRDLGRLRAAKSYEFHWGKGDVSKFGGPVFDNGQDWNVLRPTANIRVDRDANHDGRFDAADEALYVDAAKLDAGDSVLFHQGNELKDASDPSSILPNSITGSAGCQTMPRSEFRGGFAGSLDPADGQDRFLYTIMEM